MQADIRFPDHRRQQFFAFGAMMRGLDCEAVNETTVNVTYQDVEKVLDLVADQDGEVIRVI